MTITLDELMQKQRALSDKQQALAAERDVEKIQSIVSDLEREGKELEALARAFETQELAKAKPAPKGKLEVVLTPDQRERVKKETGIEMASVFIADEAGVLSKAMPHTSKADVLAIAIAEARRLASNKNSDAAMRNELERAVAEIDAAGTGEVRNELERLKADPNWMNGLLYKK